MCANSMHYSWGSFPVMNLWGTNGIAKSHPWWYVPTITKAAAIATQKLLVTRGSIEHNGNVKKWQCVVSLEALLCKCQ